MKRLINPRLGLVLGLASLSFARPSGDGTARPSGNGTATPSADFTGYAYQQGTGRLLYKEESSVTSAGRRPLEDVTRYYNPGGNLIASRTLKFQPAGYTPDFVTEDYRTGYLEGAEVKNNTVRLFVRENKTAPLREKTFPLRRTAVIDGGFNQFIKDQWTNLEQGKELSFDFMVPSRLDFYSFRVTRVSETAEDLVVRIEPGSMLVRWLAGAITVRYDRATQRMLSYEGKSNITDEKGENLAVRLVYPQEGP